MQPDSEEINLSTVELQVLSELDSRQYGFLKLNTPDHAKKKAVVIKAIKYLERMLIQAQCQHDREKRCKITANDKEITNATDEAATNLENNNNTTNSNVIHSANATVTVDDATDVEMLDLDAKNKIDTNNTTTTTISTQSTANASNTMPEIKTEPMENDQMEVDTSKEIKIEDNDEDDLYSKDIAIEPRTYCKLGHFHLLLEDYPKALSAYQKFYSLEKDNWKDPQFCYGLGLVYFHYNAYKWATKAFQQLLYVSRDFVRANEVHLRLGLMFKVNNDFESALKHLQIALSDAAPCTFSKLEIRFHVAHLYEAQNKYNAAREAYQQLLDDRSLTYQLRADVYRQLGWMYHCVEMLGDKRQREMQALGYLQKSIQSDPKSGQSLYLLGRCFAGVNKVHDAFIAYRNSVEKSEGNADTWCSIGVLYQQQNQPMDALQAYICAVQLDKTHRAAWTNLGILYESCSQPRDAYACYLNATKYSKNNSEQIQHLSVSSTTNQATGSTNTSTPICTVKQAKEAAAAVDKGDKIQALTTRLKFLQSQLAHAPMPSVTSKRRQLPSIEEAWNLPISAEMSSRQQQNAQANQRAKYNTQISHGPPPPYPHHQSNNVIPPKRLFDISGEKAGHAKLQPQHQIVQQPQPQPLPQQQQQQHSTPSFYLTHQQLQMLQHLQKNHENLTPQHQAMLQQLTNQYRMMQQHQQQLRLQQQQQLRGQPGSYIGASPGNPSTPGQSPVAAGYPIDNNGPMPIGMAGGIPNAQTPAVATVPGVSFKIEPGTEYDQQNQFKAINGSGYNTQITSTTNQPEMDQEIEALLSQKEITASLAENLLKQLSNDGMDIKEEIPDDPMCGTTTTNDSMSPSQNGVADSTTNSNMVQTPPIKCEATSTSAKHFPTSKPDNADKNEPVLRIENIFEPRKADFTNEMDSKAMADAVKLIGSKEPPAAYSILPDNCPPPCPPVCILEPLPREQIYPTVPSLHLENKKQAYGPETQEFCLKHPVTVIRGIAAALKLDLGLFATRSLVEANPSHIVEIRTQPFAIQDDAYGKRVWNFASHRSHSTIEKYAGYQVSSFQDSLKEERDKGPGAHLFSDNDSKDSSNNNLTGPKNKKKNKNATKAIRFGTNIDISDDQKWRSQLQELQKLPPFARVVSAGNMLSHMGNTTLGMNTVQLYMKVPGSRTTAHQANNNFGRVNINIGPGECEWFTVAEEYWGAVYALCEKYNINYLHGSWWPIIDDLQREHIPVYRFIQRPGDLIWINSGSIYWVQAIGWCNNVAWNVGPMTARQYQLSVERYEWNKMQNYKSTVPMVHLSWQLAKHLKISDRLFYDLMRNCLMQTLKHTMLSLDYIKSKGLDARLHRRGKVETIHYCGQCENEVFNVLLVNEQDNRYVVNCIGCARKQSPTLQGFVCLKEYRLSELSQVYDAFILHDPPPPPPATSITPLPFEKDKDKDIREKSIQSASPAHAGSPLTPIPKSILAGMSASGAASPLPESPSHPTNQTPIQTASPIQLNTSISDTPSPSIQSTRDEASASSASQPPTPQEGPTATAAN